MGAAGFRFELMHGARKAVRRQPLCQRIGLGESAVDFLWLGRQHTMQSNSVGHRKFDGQFNSWTLALRRSSVRPIPLATIPDRQRQQP